MTVVDSSYYQQVIEELDQVPVEYMPALLKLMRTFREGATLRNAEESFRQGWQEAMTGETYPITELWNDLDAE